MLERLRIQNFKSWQDTGDMAFGSLTGFFGTNSSGKSSILQFLLMLKQTVESSDRSLVLNLGEGSSYVELGTLPDILYRGKKSKDTLAFSFNWQVINMSWVKRWSRFTQEIASNHTLDTLSFGATIRQTDNSTQLLKFGYLVRGRKLGMSLSSKAIDTSRQYNFMVHGTPIKNHPNNDYRFSKPLNFYKFPKDTYADRFNDEVINISVFELERLFEKLFYLGPLREYPNRLYLWAGEQPQSVGNRGERAVAALLSSRNQGPTIDMGEDQLKRTVEEHVAHWLKELGLIYSFKVQPIAPNRKEYEVRIQRTAESASVFLTDVGFGVSQILPVLVLLFYVPEGSTVILEQPEIHLHPAVQAGLADVFIDAIKRRKLQIILESHSEHLLQRLQRRMAEEVIAPDDIKLYFTSIEAGKSKLTPLQLDEYGNINNWPEGFFGDTMGEAAAMMKAEMERRMRQQPS
jgi:predicted ATPase